VVTSTKDVTRARLFLRELLVEATGQAGMRADSKGDIAVVHVAAAWRTAAGLEIAAGGRGVDAAISMVWE